MPLVITGAYSDERALYLQIADTENPDWERIRMVDNTTILAANNPADFLANLISAELEAVNAH